MVHRTIAASQNPHAGWVSRRLRGWDRDAYAAHLCALDGIDRRLRFGTPRGDAAIEAYVAAIDFAHDAVYVVTDETRRVVGAAHLARAQSFGEAALSVLPGWRRRGIGTALIERCRVHARNRGLHRLVSLCAADNHAMRALAAKAGLRATLHDGEAEGTAPLPRADASSFASEVFAERAAAFDDALKRQCAAAAFLVRALAPARRAA